MKTIIDFVAHMLVMKILAPTQGEENSIAMLVHMSVLHKLKTFNKIVTKRIAMPTMGVTTNPTTTSSSTWTRHHIVNHMLMLMIKVIKNNQGVIFVTTHGTTIMEEEIRNMIMRKKAITEINKNFNILVKIVTNTNIAP